MPSVKLPSMTIQRPAAKTAALTTALTTLATSPRYSSVRVASTRWVPSPACSPDQRWKTLSSEPEALMGSMVAMSMSVSWARFASSRRRTAMMSACRRAMRRAMMRFTASETSPMSASTHE